MKIQFIATGLLALLCSGFAPAMADPYLGEWRYRQVHVHHNQKGVFHQRREAAIDMREGRYGAARYHERQAIRAQHEANWDRLGGW